MSVLLSVRRLAGAVTAERSALADGGAQPKHGGVVSTASDLGFELVGIPTRAAIYDLH